MFYSAAFGRAFALALLFTALPALAQPADPPVPDWAQVETVDVTARPGPALWHITRGDSEVWILGMVGAMPKDLDWNRQTLADVMDGARAIIMPPRGNISLLSAGWFLITHVGDLDTSLPRGQTLQAMTPEPVWMHLMTTAAALGDKPEHYTNQNPMGAAQHLNQALAKNIGLGGNEPMTTIFKLAREKKVPQQPAMQFDVLPIVKEAVKLSPQQQEPCLDEAITDVDRMNAHALAAARAWAVGDVKNVKANFAESRFNDCAATIVHAYGNVDQQRATAFTAAIDDALNKPGKTIVVMGMGPLLRKGGVLEQLSARHVTIEGPAE
jgi:uncharacterized protein YbaP (TraB family)